MREAMRVIGHRGARFEAPENTVTGFRYALGLGLDGFELDVRMTADDELVVIHDATVDRTTNGAGAVSGQTLAEIRALDARAGFPDWPEPAIVPTLSEVLDAIRGTPWIEIEIKTDSAERIDRIVPKVIGAIRDYGIEETAFITSFDRYALETARRVGSDIRRGYVCAYESPADLDEALRLGASLIGFPYATGNPVVAAAAKAMGLLRSGWPTNSQEVLDRAIALDLDAICTDAPTAIKEQLARKRHP